MTTAGPVSGQTAPEPKTTASLRFGLLASLVALTAAGCLSAYGWTHTPAGARIAVHFDASGQANGYGGKVSAFLVLPLVMLGVTVLFLVITRIDPRRGNLARSARAFDAIWAVTLGVLLYAHASTVLTAVHRHRSINNEIMFVLVGLMYVVIGNYLPKLRSSWFLGIRTPWTLSDERTWARTHRLAGPLMMALGAVVAVVALTTHGPVALVVLLAGSGVLFGGLIVYSYVISPAPRESA